MNTTASTRTKKISTDQLAKHNSSSSIWVAYKNKVYDLTDFADNHPGGSDVISKWAGKIIDNVLDSTHKHSQFAHSILADHYIGDLVLEGSPQHQHQHIHQSSQSSHVQETKANVQSTAADISAMDDRTATLPDAAMDRKTMLDQSTQRAVLEGESDTCLNDEMKLAKDDKFLDLSKPLFWQVWNNQWTKDYYLQQVHIPRYLSKSPRFFHSDFLEPFSRNVWWMVPVFWIPIISYLVYSAYDGLSIPLLALLLATGLLSWTLLEYVVHRFLFHMDRIMPDSPKLFAIHFTMHGVHHFLPTDSYRLVMPPALAVTLTVPVVCILKFIFLLSHSHLCAVLGGLISGFVIYDLLHYSFHHLNLENNVIFKQLKTHHMDHHYVSPNMGFGVSSMLWDYFFHSMELPRGTNSLLRWKSD